MDPSGVMPRRAFTIRTEGGIHRRISQEAMHKLVRSRMQQARALAGRRTKDSSGGHQSQRKNQGRHFFPKDAFPTTPREDADATKRAGTPSHTSKKAVGSIATDVSGRTSSEEEAASVQANDVFRTESCYDQAPEFQQKFSWSSVEDCRDDQEPSFLRDGLRSMATSDDSLEQTMLEIETISDDEGWENERFGSRNPRLSPTNTTRPLPESPVYRNKVLVADSVANTSGGSNLVENTLPIISPSESKKDGKCGSLLRVSRTRAKDQPKMHHVLKETQQGRGDKNRMVQEAVVSVSAENVDTVVQEAVRQAREAAKQELAELLKESVLQARQSAADELRQLVQTSMSAVIPQSNTDSAAVSTRDKKAVAQLEVRTHTLPYASEISGGLKISTELERSPEEDGDPDTETFNELQKPPEKNMETYDMGTPQSPLMISESLEDRVQRGQSPLWSFVKDRASQIAPTPQHSDHFFPENKFRDAEWPYFEHNGEQKQILATLDSDAFPFADSFASNATHAQVPILSEERKAPDQLLPWTSALKSIQRDNVRLVDGFPVVDSTEIDHDKTVEEFSDFQWPQWPHVEPPSTDPFDVWGDSSDQWPQQEWRDKKSESNTQLKEPFEDPDALDHIHGDQLAGSKPGDATGVTETMVREADHEHLQDAKSGGNVGGQMKGGPVDGEEVETIQQYLTPSVMMYQGSDDFDELLCLSTSTDSETPFDEPTPPRAGNMGAQSNSPKEETDQTALRAEDKTISSEVCLSPSPEENPEEVDRENKLDEVAMSCETATFGKEDETVTASPKRKGSYLKVTFRERTSPIPPPESETFLDEERESEERKEAGRESVLRSSSQENTEVGNLALLVEDPAAQAIVDSLRSTLHDSAVSSQSPPPPPPPPPTQSSSKRTKASSSKSRQKEDVEQDDVIVDERHPFVSHLDSKRAENVISPLSLPTMYDSDTYMNDEPMHRFTKSVQGGCTETNVPSPCRSLPNRQEVFHGVFCTNILDVIRTESYETQPIVSLRTPSAQTYDNSSQEDDNSYTTSLVETWMESVAEHIEGTSPSSGVRQRKSRQRRDTKKQTKSARKEDPSTNWIWSLADRLDFAVDHINVALGANEQTDAEDTESEDESLPVLSDMKRPSFSFSDGEEAVENENPFRLSIANASRLKGASSSRRRQSGRKVKSPKGPLREPIALGRSERGRSLKRENAVKTEKS
jgi:hypothetical protein